jgi:hypothetical protein
MKLTLHVGLPKTATTTVQHTLSAAKLQLADLGVCYPGHSVVHHEIIRAIELVAAGKTSFEGRAEELLAAFAEEAERSSANHVLISSEAMFSASPAAILRMRDMLVRYFPAITEFSILCYVREPIAFAASLGQQGLKSGVSRLSDLYQNPWNVRLKASLTNYIAAYGRDHVHVRYFHPDHLKNRDVVADFLDALGLSSLILPASAATLNSSLSSEGAMIADALAEIRPRGKRQRSKRKAYKRILEGIAGSKFVLPREVQDRVIEGSREDMAALKEIFGLEVTPHRVDVPEGTPMPTATALSIARIIEKFVETT